MIKFKSLTDHVYDHIAEEILQGKILPGEKINESEISNSLSISRTPVREALIELSRDGILLNVPRKGFIVKKLTFEDLKNLYSVIGMLEGEAAGLACDKLDKQALDNMKFYIDGMYLALDQSNYSMYHKQQDAFHNIFIQVCDNDVLIAVLENLKNQLLRKTYDENSHPNIKEVLVATNDEHKKIYELFKAKDSKGVAKYLKNVHWDIKKAEFEML